MIEIIRPISLILFAAIHFAFIAQAENAALGFPLLTCQVTSVGGQFDTYCTQPLVGDVVVINLPVLIQNAGGDGLVFSPSKQGEFPACLHVASPLMFLTRKNIKGQPVADLEVTFGDYYYDSITVSSKSDGKVLVNYLHGESSWCAALGCGVRGRVTFQCKVGAGT
jgi:hypothetical protein